MNSRKMKQIVHVSRLHKYITQVRPAEEPDLIEDDDFDWEQEVTHIREGIQPISMTTQETNQLITKATEGVAMELSEEYEVQSITDIQKVDGRIQYLVRWKEYSAN